MMDKRIALIAASTLITTSHKDDISMSDLRQIQPSLNEIYGKRGAFEYLINSFDFVGEMNRLFEPSLRDTRPIRLGGRKKHRVASPAKRSKRKAQNAARKHNK